MLAGRSAGSWIVGVEAGLLQCWSVGSVRGSSLQKKNKTEEGPAGASPVAAPMLKSVSF